MLGELRQQRRKPGKNERQRAQGECIEDRTGNRDTGSRQPGGEQRYGGGDRSGGHQERGQGGFVAGDATAQEQFKPAGLFLAARRPRHQGDAQQRQQEGGHETKLVLDDTTKGVDAFDLAIDGEQGVAGGDGLGVTVDLGRAVIEGRDTGCGADHGCAQHQHPQQGTAPLTAANDAQHDSQPARLIRGARSSDVHDAASAALTASGAGS